MDVTHEVSIRCDGDLTRKDINGQTPLHTLYYAGTCGTSMLEQVFLHGNDTKFVNTVDSHGVSNFHLCCSLNNPDFVKVFLDREVDVNSAISFSCSRNPGFTPLHFAVKYNCTEVVELLLKNGADCNKGDKEGSTALHLACEKADAMFVADSKIIDMLLEFDASPAAADEKGVTPLHRVFHEAEDLRESIIDKFCSKISRKVNFTDDKGLSYFHIFCTRGDTSRVNDFLDSGVAVDSCVASGLYSGYTALHFAVLCNQNDIVELLLQNNAQVNIKTDQFQLTPLHIACKFYMKYSAMDVKCYYNPAKVDWVSRSKNDLAMIELLLRCGADVDAQDSLGKTPLIQMCTVDKIIYSQEEIHLSDSSIFSRKFHMSQKKIIDVLLSNNANVNARTNKEETSLHAITKSNFLSYLNEDLVERLILKGADLNAADADGLTPLHLAVQFINTTLVNLFLKYQSDVNALTKDLITPLEMAIDSIDVFSSKPTKDIVLALLKYGANVNVLNECGRTLLEDAVKHRMTFVVEQLLHNGADLNLKGSSKYSTAAFLKDWHRKLSDIELLRAPAFGQIVKIIFIHTQKLLALGVDVDDKIQKWCIRLLHRLKRARQHNRRRRQYSPIDFIVSDGLYDDCVQEVERMKFVKINRSTSLYDVLLLKDAETLSKQIKNNIFVEIMEDQSRFPLYSFLLNRQLNKALKRRNEMENAKTSLSYISGIQMPDLCSESVLKYLTTEEIVKLNVAVIIEEKSKRK